MKLEFLSFTLIAGRFATDFWQVIKSMEVSTKYSKIWWKLTVGSRLLWFFWPRDTKLLLMYSSSQFCETLVGPKLWQSGSGFRGPIWDLLLGAVFETSCPRSAFQTFSSPPGPCGGRKGQKSDPFHPKSTKKNTLFQHVWPSANTVLYAKILFI